VRVDPRKNAHAPEARGITRPPLCFVCYQYGHFLTDCPRLPAVLQKEAAANRAQCQQRRQSGTAHTGVSGIRQPSKPFPTPGSPPAGLLPHNGRGEVMAVEEGAVAPDTGGRGPSSPWGIQLLSPTGPVSIPEEEIEMEGDRTPCQTDGSGEVSGNDQGSRDESPFIVRKMW
jgi:hypothetical protein